MQMGSLALVNPTRIGTEDVDWVELAQDNSFCGDVCVFKTWLIKMLLNGQILKSVFKHLSDVIHNDNKLKQGDNF
jgi:hypothetical protein